MGVIHMGNAEATANVKLSDIGLGRSVKTTRVLWKHADAVFQDGVYSAMIPSHGVLMMRVGGRYR